ncbi:hypothetical protein pb186bvf_004211 [Paramecium bursaria]
MSNIDALKKYVAENIENGGFLDGIRAQLKTQVYKIVDNMDQKSKDKNGFQWEHPLLKQIKGMTEGVRSLELIIEYLEFFKLSYTAEVLRKEANLTEPIIRDKLANQIGLNIRDTLPLLMIMVQQFGREESVSKNKPDTQNEQLKKAAQVQEEKAKELAKQKEKEKQDKLDKEKKEKERIEKEQLEKQKASRPQTAPIAKVEPPAPVVNKIRGIGGKQNQLSSMFGLDLNQPIKEDPIFGNSKNQPSKKQAKQSAPSDPYAFDFDAPVQQNQGKKQVSDPYAFEYEQPTKQTGPKKQYDYDLNQTIGKKFNTNMQPASKHQDIEEDIEFIESKDERIKQSNNMFTSEEDYQKATQSMGIDESVDSLALEDYDYIEDVIKKKR